MRGALDGLSDADLSGKFPADFGGDLAGPQNA
jgi:hypothetical protein